MHIPKKKDIFAHEFIINPQKTQQMMIQTDKELVFSESVKAGKRIYYFDVKQSRNGDRYIAITESKKVVSGDEDNPQVSYEKHKLFLYKEDFDKFISALRNAIDIAGQGQSTDHEQSSAPQADTSSSDIDIQF